MLTSASLHLADQFICDFTVKRRRYLKSRYLFLQSTCNKFRSIKSDVKKGNKLRSFDLNLIKILAPNELSHSNMISQLLNPNGYHGQENLFLHRFLLKLNIEKPETKNWLVTCEKGKVDVLLKRDHPHSVILIENKSNLALDQENQLYRYWYKEIYSPILKRQGHEQALQWGKNRNYKLLYLTPEDWKIPSDNSRKRPLNYTFSNLLPNEIPIESINIWRYKENIVAWLKEVLPFIPSNNFRLKEYIIQYIEFWT